MSTELKPTKNQLGVMQLMAAGKRLCRHDFANGSVHYTLEGAKVHMNTAQSIIRNGWAYVVERTSNNVAPARVVTTYQLARRGYAFTGDKAAKSELKPTSPMW